MYPKNICPDCKKTYTKLPASCPCGWYFLKDKENNLDKSKCHYLINGKQCNQVGSVSISVRGNEWFCSFHADEMREKSYQR